VWLVLFWIALAGVFLSFGAIVILLVDLFIKTRSIPNLPPSVRFNPLNILAHRDLWTPEIQAANRRINVAGLCFLGFIVLGIVIAVSTVKIP